MDKDSDPALVSSENYIDALDIYNGYGSDVGTAVFGQGTSKINLTLPSGNNTCIGCCEDKQTPSLIYFIYNDTGKHCIVRWFNVAAISAPRIIAQGAALDFNVSRRITHAHVVDGRILYWTDVTTASGTVVGNPQRMLDMTKGDPLQNAEYEIYAGLPGEGQFAAGNSYAFSQTNWDGTSPTNTHIYTADGSHLNDPVSGLAALAAWLTTTYGSLIVVTECDGCKIKVRVNTSGKRFSLVNFTGDIKLVGVSLYPVLLELQHIDLLKEPGHQAPKTTFLSDTSYKGNNVFRVCAQFSVRYIYYNGERSAWSPVSNVALNTGNDGEPIAALNYIEVEFTDDRLKNVAWLTMIRSVEIAFRDGNTNPFRLIDRIDVCEIGILRQYYKFYNDKIYPVVESDENSESGAQALKPFDFLPIRSGCLEISSGSDGSALMFLGANEELYDCPDCVDVELETSAVVDDCLIDISGTVVVHNYTGAPTVVPFLDTPDYDVYPLGGFVVYLVGTPYYAISNNPADGTGDGRFKIQNVPRGKYIVRVASFRCAFVDAIAPRYDMNNGLEWQRTSSPTIQVVYSGERNEFFLDISAFTGSEYDFTVEDAPGEIIIQNGHYHSRKSNVSSEHYVLFVEKYLLDNEGKDDFAATRIGALNCELQQRSTVGGSATGDPADHNGYNWSISDQNDESWVVTSNYQHLFGTDPRSMYVGDYDKMYSDTLLNIPSLEASWPDFEWGMCFIINKSETFTARKRALDVSALDGDGMPLVGALIVYQRCTRFVLTGTTGGGRIVAYAQPDDMPRVDWLIIFWSQDRCYLHYVLTNPREISFDPLTTPEIPQYEEPFLFDVSGGISDPIRYLKAGGSYDIGVVYEDRGNRTCGAVKAATLVMPYHISPYGMVPRSVMWSILSVPPIWATHYRFVRTKNAIHQFYVQWAIPKVIYFRIPSQNEDPIPTTYAAGDYTHIALQLYVPPVPPTTGAYFFPFFQQDGQYGYEPAAGDKVRFILNEVGDPLTTSTNYYEAPIVGKYVDGTANGNIYAMIENVFGNLEIKANFLVEYYTPRNIEDNVYYEGGEDGYEILDAGTVDRRHAGPIQDQVLPDTPAQGKLTFGDTYWRRDSYTGTSSVLTEHQSPTRSGYVPCEDIGRAFALNPDGGQIFFYNRVRFSGRYVVDSKHNGLSSYRGLDYQDINRAFGIITWLGFSNNVLLAICRFKVQPLYVNRDRLLQLDGDSSVGRSTRILVIADESITNFGTHNPESVVSESGYVYFWDKYNGAVCRYATNGVQPIVTGMTKYFLAKGRERMPTVGDQVIAGYDRRHNYYVLSFAGSGEAIVDTLAYDEAAGGWKSRYRFLPEAFGQVGPEFVSFKNGELWRHFQNALYTNYYGTQYKPQIQFAANEEPSAVKQFWSTRIIANREWEFSAITIPFNGNYLTGMSSRLKANRFNAWEGAWWADFLRDMNDTSARFLAIVDIPTRQSTALQEGRWLRGEYALITMVAVDGSKSMILKRVDTYYTQSQLTNP